MKKIIILILVVLLFSISNVFSADDSSVSSSITDGYCNGMFLYDKNIDANYKDGYLLGVLNALEYINLDHIRAIYPNATTAEIMDAIKLYYKQNPLKKDRPIVEVILSGCQ